MRVRGISTTRRRDDEVVVDEERIDAMTSELAVTSWTRHVAWAAREYSGPTSGHSTRSLGIIIVRRVVRGHTLYDDHATVNGHALARRDDLTSNLHTLSMFLDYSVNSLECAGASLEWS